MRVEVDQNDEKLLVVPAQFMRMEREREGGPQQPAAAIGTVYRTVYHLIFILFVW